MKGSNREERLGRNVVNTTPRKDYTVVVSLSPYKFYFTLNGRWTGNNDSIYKLGLFLKAIQPSIDSTVHSSICPFYVVDKTAPSHDLK